MSQIIIARAMTMTKQRTMDIPTLATISEWDAAPRMDPMDTARIAMPTLQLTRKRLICATRMGTDCALWRNRKAGSLRERVVVTMQYTNGHRIAVNPQCPSMQPLWCLSVKALPRKPMMPIPLEMDHSIG